MTSTKRTPVLAYQSSDLVINQKTVKWFEDLILRRNSIFVSDCMDDDNIIERHLIVLFSLLRDFISLIHFQNAWAAIIRQWLRVDKANKGDIKLAKILVKTVLKARERGSSQSSRRVTTTHLGRLVDDWAEHLEVSSHTALPDNPKPTSKDLVKLKVLEKAVNNAIKRAPRRVFAHDDSNRVTEILLRPRVNAGATAVAKVRQAPGEPSMLNMMPRKKRFRGAQIQMLNAMRILEDDRSRRYRKLCIMRARKLKAKKGEARSQLRDLDEQKRVITGRRSHFQRQSREALKQLREADDELYDLDAMKHKLPYHHRRKREIMNLKYELYGQIDEAHGQMSEADEALHELVQEEYRAKQKERAHDKTSEAILFGLVDHHDQSLDAIRDVCAADEHKDHH
ncbi:hypothetical protein PG993_007455 [Apiospora rasikravindrae]|uniref:Uncharacterized protein n=1 Tax=Apiospora rasikravindrae TaxID=990691 RepID=A0ABR1SXJ2_9PEZI